MGLEIEKKFLVKDNSWKSLATGVLYQQGYLNTEKERTVRVRVIDQQGFLTIKGKSTGATRLEFEYEIPVEEAKEMLFKLCGNSVLEKYRYKIPFDGMIWEVDEFLGKNQGLIVAEVEMKSEDQVFELPKWIGEEVTHETKYFNSQLTQKPFSEWESQ
jgi:adenylate cyclase